MPPKRKGKKKSKEELEAERKAREEEEERARQAELARLEEERLAKEAAEKAAKEEADRLRAEELVRLKEEADSEEHLRLRKADWLKRQVRAEAEAEEWDRFRECSRRPNAAVESELNTYITECGEEEEEDVKEGLAACQRTEEIVGDLEAALARASEVGDQDTVDRCIEARRRLRDLSAEKIDRVTAHMLDNAFELSTELKEGVRETKISHETPAAKLGVWVNLTAKGGRMRSVHYPDLGMSVDVPKPIATQLVAVRIIHLPYDHAASTASYINQLAALVGEESGAAGGATASRSRAAAGKRARRASVTEGGEETKDGGADGSDGAGEGSGSGGGAAAEPPAEALTVLGGTFYVELLGLPRPAKRVKHWTMRQDTALSSTVNRQPHPMAGQSMSVAAAQALKLRVTMPSTVILPSELTVKAWDAEEGKWDDHGITEHHFDAATRLLTVHTINLSALAVVQPRHVEFPFKSWRVNPMSTTACQLVLSTQRFRIKIQVSDSRCQLISPDLPELAHLKDTPLRPGRLLAELAKCGINITPIDADAKLLPSGSGITPKASAAENLFHADVATLCAGFSIAGSRWNQSTPADTAVLRVKETLEYDVPDSEIHETDWRTIKYLKDTEAPLGLRCGIIRATESATEYHGDLSPSESFHNAIRKTIAARSTPEACEVVDDSAPLYQQTLQYLLSLIRPLSFA